MKLYITLEKDELKVERVLTTTHEDFYVDVNMVVEDMIDSVKKSKQPL